MIEKSEEIEKTKIALITGASRGIGQAIALELLNQNYFVIGTATSDEGAEKINQRLNQNNKNGRGVKLNVNNQEEIDKLITEILKNYEKIDVLVNNAGITRDTLTLRMKESDWDEVLNTNLKAVFRLSKAVIKPMMKQQFGRIINISSIVGTTGNAGQINYSAAKAGLTGLTKSLAKELGSRNITVNCVAPGFIETDMTAKLSEEQKNNLLKQIPLNKLGKPEDIANVVSFLANEKSSYITGQEIHVNGGMFM